MGIIKEFFARIGIHKLWFKPTYNPYTEPSMEIYGNYYTLFIMHYRVSSIIEKES